jgi:uncharacterized membrane protein
MAEVHGLVNAWRSGDAGRAAGAVRPAKGDDPIPPVADVIAAEARLLCFDEFQVTDIADAMILGRLFEALFARGVTLVATSNRRRTISTSNGLNRQLFLPFIAMLKEKRMEVVRWPAARLSPRPPARRRGPGSRRSTRTTSRRSTAVAAMLGGDPRAARPWRCWAASEHWPRAAGGLLRAHFASLCGTALGPSDYLAIAERFHTVFLEAGARSWTPESRDEARRLATLIDTLYEARARWWCWPRPSRTALSRRRPGLRVRTHRLAAEGDALGAMYLQAGPHAPFLLRAGADALIVLHIGGGVVGMLSGAVVLAAPKGKKLHKMAGTVFFVAMLIMSGIGACVAPFLPHEQASNTMAGVFTFYLVLSGWMTMRRSAGVVGRFEIAALGVPLAACVAGLSFIWIAAHSPDGMMDGEPPQANYLFTIVGAIAAAGDLKMILRKGISGVQRLARHLWRLCVGLFIAAGSFFLGQQQVFPHALQGSVLLMIPPFAVLGAMVFWLVRVRLVKRTRGGGEMPRGLAAGRA